MMHLPCGMAGPQLADHLDVAVETTLVWNMLSHAQKEDFHPLDIMKYGI